jgi:uncharacterized protein (TIGR00269 family)
MTCMPVCDRCSENSIYLRRSSGQRFCSEHFVEYFEKKVKKTVLKERMIERGEKTGVALSGGKDSTTVLKILTKMGFEVCAILIDEGIEGYRKKTIKYAKELCKKLEVRLHVVSFKEAFGHTLDEIKENAPENACTYCGVFRRMLLNKKAGQLGLDKLATGHNLDDETQAILMNYIRADLNRLIRLGISSDKKGMVKRIKPLKEMPEKEVALFTHLKGLDVSFDECPYQISFRSGIRDFINQLEDENPGIKFSILRGYQKIFPYISKHELQKLKRCERCGGPSSQKTCKACKLLDTIKARDKGRDK